jgi:diadenosine tetraphosphate (Ap4A) HIT family hydrolase
MPVRIQRDVAVARVAAEREGEPCLICALRDGRAGAGPILRETRHTVTVLDRYPARWGHVLILLREHCESLADVGDDAWTEAGREALRAGRALEATLRPLRCYIGSFGTSRDIVAMSSPHLHLHVIPVYDAADRPSTVLTWREGVYAATEDEWSALRDRVASALASTVTTPAR